jgi:hypothetical protein
MSPADLQAAAQELLDAAIDALDAIPDFEPELEGAPARTFISPGQPALEGCDQLAVHAALVTAADTAPGGLAAGRRDAAILWHVQLVITVDRCVLDTRGQGIDVMNQPYKAEDLTNTSAQTNADGWALLNGIYDAWRSGHLFTLCSELFFDGLRALPEEGGRAGWTLTLRLRLDGFETVPST